MSPPENDAAPRTDSRGAGAETLAGVETDRTSTLRHPSGTLPGLGSGVFRARDLAPGRRGGRQAVILAHSRAIAAAAQHLPSGALRDLEETAGAVFAELLGFDPFEVTADPWAAERLAAGTGS